MSRPDAGAAAVANLFDGAKYCPGELNAEEQALLAAMTGSWDGAPAWAAGNYPEWLAPCLTRRFGTDLEGEMSAMGARADVDLRVNVLKTDAARVAASLAKDDIATTPGALAPTALRLADRRSLANHPLYQSGAIEIQDEGSQLVALLCAARSGQQVVDFCSGAGGKSLALAAGMVNKGQIFAFDNNPRRMRPLRERLQRAGVRNIQLHALADAAARKVLADLRGKADRVLLDVPCSGSGAWRRNPESKWRLSPEQLEHFGRTQTEILNLAAPLVAPGGRLIYATCSILMEENEDRIEAFLAEQSGFEVLSISEVWAETLGGDAPCDDPYLRLTPARHGTDGFFLAVLQRRQT
jgi:16S rRNA (cytosine967-C5)-methyltransferase